MKRTSRRARKREKLRQAGRQRPLSGSPQKCERADKPLGGMVITRRHVYEPTRITEEMISAAHDNTLHVPVSQIIFKPAAVKHLKSFIDWGRHTVRNGVEQQGILVGQVYQSPTGYVGMVEDVLLSGAVGNSVYIESSHSEWAEMDRQLDEMNRHRAQPLVKVGWWHTHPNMNVFMSGTDRATQDLYFYRDWQFAVVLNPQAEKWAAFIGGEAKPCDGCFVNTNLFKLKRIEDM